MLGASEWKAMLEDNARPRKRLARRPRLQRPDLEGIDIVAGKNDGSLDHGAGMTEKRQMPRPSLSISSLLGDTGMTDRHVTLYEKAISTASIYLPVRLGPGSASGRQACSMRPLVKMSLRAPGLKRFGWRIGPW